MQTQREASPGDAAPQVPAPARRRAVVVLALVAVTLYVIDQVTKVIVVRLFEGEPPRELLGPLLRLYVIRNSGAAFSIAGGQTVILSLVAIAVIVAVVHYARRLASRWWAAALGLLLAGAFGNLTDRIFRAPGLLRGHVVDFLELPHWPIFNVADMCIVTGGALIVLLSVLSVPFEGRAASPDGEDG